MTFNVDASDENTVPVEGNTFTLDFTAVPEGLLPEGTYEGEIMKVTLKKSKNSGENYLQFAILVFDETYGDTWVNGIASFAGGALAITQRKLKSLGMIGPDGKLSLETGDSGNVLTPDVTGMVVSVTITHREWQGENRLNCKDFRPVTAKTLSVPDNGQVLPTI